MTNNNSIGTNKALKGIAIKANCTQLESEYRERDDVMTFFELFKGKDGNDDPYLKKILESKEYNRNNPSANTNNTITCPHCDSSNVQKINRLALFAGSGCAVLLGIFFPPVLLLIPVLLSMAILTLFRESSWQCQDCEHTWVINKKETGCW